MIAGNWKLNKTINEAIEFATLLKRGNFNDASPEIVICPVFTALSEVAEVIFQSQIQLGAQDLHWEEKGAFTGEVSASLLKDAGCSQVIIGHSERRQFFGETDTMVNQKIKAAVASDLNAIVCCGELLEEREAGKMNEVLDRQIRGAFEGLSESQANACVIAYEPVWAIGTGKVATPDQAEEAHAFIRQLVAELISEAFANQVRILYGGSVKPENAGEILKKENVDGALVGGASLDVESFAQIIRAASEVSV